MKTDDTRENQPEEQENMSERRRKTPFDYVAPSSSMVSAGLLVFILQQITSMQDTIDDYRNLITNNTITNQRVEKTLSAMNDKFNLDIQRFEFEHARLKNELGQIMRKQEGTSVRMQGMEGTMKRNDWWTSDQDRRAMDGQEREIKSWADKRFQRKSNAE